VVLNSKEPPRGGFPTMFPLRSGHNYLRLLMATPKSYVKDHSWDVTEGWSYDLKIGLQAQGQVSCADPHQNVLCSGLQKESAPFKDGPHHGSAFVVAQVTFVVDGNFDPPKVTVEASDFDIWNREAPVWARDQKRLYEERITSLNLKADDLLDAIGVGYWKFFLRPVVDEFLKSGKIFTKQVADPSNTFATVYGNKVLWSAVQFCMKNQRAERLKDLNAGLKAAFARVGEPFKPFDQNLSECVRANAGSVVSEFPRDHLLIWTAIQEGSHDATSLGEGGMPTTGRVP